MDEMLSNIKWLMEAKNLRLDNFSPEVIAYINKFENLNDFEKQPEFYEPEKKEKKTKRRRSAKHAKQHHATGQFGFESSGQAELAAQCLASAEKIKLKAHVEGQFVNMLRDYHKHSNVNDMIENHKKILGEQSTAGQFRKKTFNREELEEQMRKEGFTDYEIGVLMKSPRMRIREAEEAREFEHQSELIKKYMHSHTTATRKLITDYKRNTINKALTEMYCTGHQRYTGKNRDLIERA